MLLRVPVLLGVSETDCDGEDDALLDCDLDAEAVELAEPVPLFVCVGDTVWESS